MILRQPIAARMSFLAWTAVVAVAIFVMPGFSTGQDSAGVADDSQPARPSKARILSAASDQPGDAAAAIDSVAGESAASPTTSDASDDAASPPRPSIATDWETDQRYNKRFSEVHNLLRELRGKGRSLTSAEKARVLQVMRIGAQKIRDARGRDDTIVNELYIQILGRRPLQSELNHGLDKLRAENFAVDGIVDHLLRSSEFVDGQSQQGGTPSLPTEPYRTKQAKAQSLLRVVYDMPRDKGEALAKFLKDHVEAGQIDVKTDQSGLVVTADANIQRTIVGIVSLMIGEPITLDLGNVPPIGYPMSAAAYQPPPYVTPTYVPAPAAQSGPTQFYLPSGAQAGRIIVPRTVDDPTTGARKTVYEERVYDGARKSDDPSTPRLTPSSAEEKRSSTTTKEAQPRP